MAATFKFGNGNWAVKEDLALAYNDENGNFKPLPFDFTRASTATRVNKDGLIENVPSGKPRIDFLDNTSGHLLLEPSRRNIFTDSEDFSSLTGVGGASASNTTLVTSPKGDSTADLLVAGGTGSVQGIYKNITFSTSTTYSISVFARAKEVSVLQLQGGGASWGGSVYVNFDLTNGTLSEGAGVVSGSAKVEDYGSGWYRCSFSATTIGTSGNVSFDLVNSLSDGRNATYSGTTGDGLYLWGGQVEDSGSGVDAEYLTSYIPTEGSSVTRSAEECFDSANSTIVNDSEGVLYAEIAALANDLSERRITLSQGGYTNRLVIAFDSGSGASNRLKVAVASSTLSFTSKLYVVDDITEFNKIALRWDSDGFDFYVNGSQRGSHGTSPNFTNDILDDLSFTNAAGSQEFFGKAKDLRIYNTALSDTEMAQLTS